MRCHVAPLEVIIVLNQLHVQDVVVMATERVICSTATNTFKDQLGPDSHAAVFSPTCAAEVGQGIYGGG